MVSRDYTKEMGLNLAQKNVPLPYVLGLVVLIFAVGGYGFASTWPAAHGHEAKKTASTAAVGSSVAVAGK
jgi:hypothetical protein